MAILPKAGKGEIMENFTLAAAIFFGIILLARILTAATQPHAIQNQGRGIWFFDTMINIVFFVWAVTLLT